MLGETNLQANPSQMVSFINENYYFFSIFCQPALEKILQLLKSNGKCAGVSKAGCQYTSQGVISWQPPSSPATHLPVLQPTAEQMGPQSPEVTFHPHLPLSSKALHCSDTPSGHSSGAWHGHSFPCPGTHWHVEGGSVAGQGAGRPGCRQPQKAQPACSAAPEAWLHGDARHCPCCSAFKPHHRVQSQHYQAAK